MGRKEVCQNSWSHHTVDKGQITLKAKTSQETQKRNYKSSWSRRLNQKSFALTIHKNLAKRVVLLPGIIVRQHLTVQKQMGLLRERYAGFHGMVLLSAMQDLLSDGKNTLRTAIRRTIQRTNNSVWLNGRISPISAEDMSRLHQFGKKVLPGILIGYVLHAGNLERSHLGRRHWGMEQMDAPELHARRLNVKEVVTPRQR